MSEEKTTTPPPQKKEKKEEEENVASVLVKIVGRKYYFTFVCLSHFSFLNR